MDKVELTDIETADDVALLVKEFYARVYRDDVLRYAFDDVAKVDLETHLPKMNRFWGTVLLDEGSYDGQPMKTHLELNRKLPLRDCHFLRWMALFAQTVDSLFAGPRAERAKEVGRRVNQSIEWNTQRDRTRTAEARRLEIIP